MGTGETTQQTVVLLGAGASADADIPMTTQLTYRVVNGISQRERKNRSDHEMRTESERAALAIREQEGDPSVELAWEEFSRRNPALPIPKLQRPSALDVVYGRLRAAAAEEVKSDLAPRVDLEELVTTLDELADRNIRGLASFVNDWDPVLLEVDHEPSGIFLGVEVGTYSIELWNFIATVVEKRLTGGSGRPFQSARTHVLRELPNHLQISEDSSVDYLAPLCAWASYSPPRSVFSLNYDLTLETAADRAGVTWSHGLEDWKMGRTISWPDEAEMRLVKLHGSLGWEQHVGPDEQSFLLGGVNKLTIQGPYLHLLLELSDALVTADTLVVIGYSFRDPHINGLIQRFFSDRHDSGDSATIRIVDPFFPIGEELPRALVPRDIATDYYLEKFNINLQVHRETAADALASGVLEQP